jgi:hypothetical protein
MRASTTDYMMRALMDVFNSRTSSFKVDAAGSLKMTIGGPKPVIAELQQHYLASKGLLACVGQVATLTVDDIPTCEVLLGVLMDHKDRLSSLRQQQVALMMEHIQLKTAGSLSSADVAALAHQLAKRV